MARQSSSALFALQSSSLHGPVVMAGTYGGLKTFGQRVRIAAIAFAAHGRGSMSKGRWSPTSGSRIQRDSMWSVQSSVLRLGGTT